MSWIQGVRNCEAGATRRAKVSLILVQNKTSLGQTKYECWTMFQRSLACPGSLKYWGSSSSDWKQLREICSAPPLCKRCSWLTEKNLQSPDLLLVFMLWSALFSFCIIDLFCEPARNLFIYAVFNLVHFAWIVCALGPLCSNWHFPPK